SVLLAPDRFPGALSAARAARRLAAGLRRVRPGVPLVELPVADGGEGTVEAAVAAGWRRVEAEVCGPTGRPVTARLALNGRSAVVELAEACGVRRPPGGKPPPPHASSIGPGQLIAHAVRRRAARSVPGRRGGPTPEARAGCGGSAGGCWTRSARRSRPAARRCAPCAPSTCAASRTGPASRWWWRAIPRARCSAAPAPPRWTGRGAARPARRSGCWTRG